jgi:hypothetical protein
MSPFVDLFQLPDADMGVDLSRGQVLVLHNDGPTVCVPDEGSGKCMSDPDCDDDACTDDRCDALGDCRHEFNTVSCDDGGLCTKNDSCAGRECDGVAVDCLHLDDPCNAGVCGGVSVDCSALDDACHLGGLRCAQAPQPSMLTPEKTHVRQARLYVDVYPARLAPAPSRRGRPETPGSNIPFTLLALLIFPEGYVATA